MLDVAIIGAGISGINSAYRLQEAAPNASYEIFEGRNEIGGTWSFFKYPGLRSDSDLFSFGFEWRSWQSDKAIAEANEILKYLKESLESFGGDKKLRLGCKLVKMDWSSEEKLWNLTFENERVQARWVILGTGYYNYESPLDVTIPGLNKFKGEIIHPQFWPNINLAGKRVAIVGSGATAITILPNIPEAQHVTIIQRSPSYIASLPKVDQSAQTLKRWLPASWATKLLRVKYLVLSFLFYNYCQRFPTAARKALAKATQAQLPSNITVDPHFKPRYGPWDQRLCMSPDGDFYAALRSGKASIVTGHIQDVSENAIHTETERIDADVIVTATGLRLLIGGGATISVDGKPICIDQKKMWKGCMLDGVPNAIAVIGYTNASWTLGADVAAKSFTRLYAETPTATPVCPPMKAVPFMKMQSTYLLKGRGSMPSAGDKYPWLPRGNYFSDIWEATYGSIRKDMVFG